VIGLNLGANRFGRHRRCDHVLVDSHVSRQHCEIHVEAEEVSIRDLGSSGGTFVNGHRIFAARLTPGDEIAISPMIRFKLGAAEIARIDEARLTARTPMEKGRGLVFRSLLHDARAEGAASADTAAPFEALYRLCLDLMQTPDPARVERRLIASTTRLCRARRTLLFYRHDHRWRFGVLPRQWITERAGRLVVKGASGQRDAEIVRDPSVLGALGLIDEDLIVAPLIARDRGFGVIGCVVERAEQRHLATLDRVAEIGALALPAAWQSRRRSDLSPRRTADYTDRTERCAAFSR
jgi:hypothetical protein